MQCEVLAIQKNSNEGFTIKTNQGIFDAENAICALGGHNKMEALTMSLKN